MKTLKHLVLSRPKIEDRYSDDRNERDYIKKMSLRDTRFRMRSSMTLTAKRSSMFSGDMGCRHCETEADETQEHLEICTGLSHEQRGLNMVEEKGKLILTNEDNLEELKKANEKPS